MNYEEKDYYQLLGVSRNATVDEIKIAYKELARIFHPDSNYYADMTDGSLTSGDMHLFKVITAAYNTLINDEERAEYDETLPPELKDWDELNDPTSDWDDPQQYLRWKEKENKSKEILFGTSAAMDYEDDETDEDDVMSVSEIIRQEREAGLEKNTLKQNLRVSIIVASIIVLITFLI